MYMKRAAWVRMSRRRYPVEKTSRNSFRPQPRDRPRDAPTSGASVIPVGGEQHDTGYPMSDRSNPTKGHVSRREIMAALGSVVYAARLADGTVKIGHTERFQNRLRYLSHYTGQTVELLAFRPGTYEDEQAIHAMLVEHRAPLTERAREYYYPTPEVLAVVNAMRADLKMPPVAA